MSILITGANGFVGQALVNRLAALHEAGQSPIEFETATLLDIQFDRPAPSSRFIQVTGSIGDSAVLKKTLSQPFDVVFHLASVPGGLAEKNYALGRSINLDATLELLELLRDQPKPPIVIFASTIGVFGAPIPKLITDDTPARPNNMSYSAQKMIGEILLDDFSRRGWIDGRSLRLPGIVARPPQPNGAISIFMSDVIRELAEGRSYTCPVSAKATAWLMSAQCVADNLLHAVGLSKDIVDQRRTWMLPVIRTSMGELVNGIAELFGADVLQRIKYEPIEAVEAVFGHQPPLDVPVSIQAGFRNDGTLRDLIQNALKGAD